MSILTIDVGYLFEGVGIPLGEFEFGSRTLTRPVPPGTSRPRSENQLLDVAWQFRINRFRGTWLGGLPTPLPEHYLLGFDEQKIETEGIPHAILRGAIRDRPRIDEERRVPRDRRRDEAGYTVYLNGELRETGWWNYYSLRCSTRCPRAPGSWSPSRWSSSWR